MLNMGFEEDIKQIFEQTKENKQVLLFSATMPKQILCLAKKYMKSDYQNINIVEKSDTSINVKQSYYLVNEKETEIYTSDCFKPIVCNFEFTYYSTFPNGVSSFTI